MRFTTLLTLLEKTSTHQKIKDHVGVNYAFLTSLSKKIRTKWGYIPFGEKFQQNAPFLKLFSDMLLFWNLILSKSSFSVELKIMKLEFFENFQVELEFIKLDSTNFFFFFKFNLPITWFSKNRFSKQGHIAK